jgi:hypothetical protein
MRRSASQTAFGQSRRQRASGVRAVMPATPASTASQCWSRFFRLTLGTAALITASIFLFVATIDPWDALPLSPPLPRLPVTSSARYAFPMLARDAGFDSAVIGTSTARLLRPALLDRLFGARFVNLSLHAATAHEETRLLQVFLQAHAQPRFILIGLDANWCDPGPEPRSTSDSFPEWLYRPSRWSGYLQLLNLYALQEAGKQLWTMLGLKPPRHRPDGYSDFGPAERLYDPARAHAHIIAAGNAPASAGFTFITHDLLRQALATLPPETRKLLFFVPFAVAYQGNQSARVHAYWSECKRRIADIARATTNSALLDFMIPNPITTNETNYYDAIHYRPAIADRISADLARAAIGAPPPNEEFRLLVP